MKKNLFHGVLLLLVVSSVHADQYRSEVKELENAPAKAVPVDEAKLLKSTTDPYARALLLRELAGKAVKTQDYDLAAKYLEDAIAQNSLSGPALEEMRRNLTELYVASGEPKRVIAALESTVKANTNVSANQQMLLASAYLKSGRQKEAVPLMEKAIAATRNPDESWLAALLAAYNDTGRDKDALPLLEKLIRANPLQREYWLALAGLQLKSGQKAKALATLELAQRQGHLKSTDERLQLIGLTAQLGAPYEAASLMQTWLRSGELPATGGNWKNLAGLWTAARESAPAIEALNEALKSEGEAALFQQLGQLQLDREDYAAAAKALEEATSRGARNGGTLMNLGMAYYQQADFTNALRAFRGAEDYPGSRALARQWIDYLSDDTRRSAIVAAVSKRKSAKRDDLEILSQRLLGPTLIVSSPVVIPVPGELPASLDERPSIAGGVLTPVGAESAANKAGTIPAWDGGLTQARWPAGFKAGERLKDPYPEDKPLFTITGANVREHESKLVAAHRALLAKYPSYKLPVYPTRRSVAYPQAIYDASQSNKGKAKLIGSDALSGAKLGFPFAEPQNGVEVMWNHRTRYRGDTVAGEVGSAVVGPSGVVLEGVGSLKVLFRYGHVKSPADIDKENIIVYGVTTFGQSARSAEFVVLFHETANSIKKSRGIWVLLTKIGRMLRIPPVGYDQPLVGTDGLAYIDMIDMYNGAFDRYVWKLTGKRELYIPYNSFRLNDGRYKNAQLLTPGHFNPEGTRYELHRVWVIEAAERAGSKHSFGKRVFYVDEDTWNVALVENYDREGRLWRFQEGHLLPFYDSQSANTFPSLTYDLKDGRYLAERLMSEVPPLRFNGPLDDQDFLPAAVKRSYSK